jgi:hypothetical protein
MYISKATAKTLVGSGLSMSTVRSTTTKLKNVVDDIRDKNHNNAIDDFELSAAVKDAGLGAKAKTALWSAMGTAESSNTDPDSGYQSPVSKSDLKATLDGTRKEIGALAKDGTLTAGRLQGKSLSSAAVKLIGAAKVAQ